MYRSSENQLQMIGSLVNRFRPSNLLSYSSMRNVFRLASTNVSSAQTDGEKKLNQILQNRFTNAKLIDVKDTSCNYRMNVVIDISRQIVSWNHNEKRKHSSSMNDFSSSFVFQLVAGQVMKLLLSVKNSARCELLINIVQFPKHSVNNYRIFMPFEYLLERMKNNLSNLY